MKPKITDTHQFRLDGHRCVDVTMASGRLWRFLQTFTGEVRIRVGFGGSAIGDHPDEYGMARQEAVDLLTRPEP